MTEQTRNQIYLERYPKIFFPKCSLGSYNLDGFLNGFSKFGFFVVEVCILIWDFRVIFENYSMRMLSIRGNDFIAHWAYEETISSHTVHIPNEFSRMLSQRKMLKVWWPYATLFAFLFFVIQYSRYIHTIIHPSFINIRWGPSPYLHSCRLSGRNLHGCRAEIRTWACLTASQRATN